MTLPWTEGDFAPASCRRGCIAGNGECDLYAGMGQPQFGRDPVFFKDEDAVFLDFYSNACGTANVFCAVEPKGGRHFTFATPDRSAVQFARVVFDLAMQYPDAHTIHLVMDNLNIHRRKSLTDLLGEEVGGEAWNRFTVHHTPTHGRWLNQAEIEIGLLSRQCLGSRRIPDLKTLRREVRAWNCGINRRSTRIKWTFDRKAARRQFGYKRKSIKRSEN